MPQEQAQPSQNITWQVLTHNHREHTTDWYWGLGVIAVVGAIVSIFFGNILFAIIIILAAGSLGALVARGPREHSVRLDGRGVVIDGTLHSYRTLKSFYVLHGEHLDGDREPKLYLSSDSMLNPRMSLPLDGEAQAQQVKSFLKRHLPEEHQDPHLGEHLTELLGL